MVGKQAEKNIYPEKKRNWKIESGWLVRKTNGKMRYRRERGGGEMVEKDFEKSFGGQRFGYLKRGKG